MPINRSYTHHTTVEVNGSPLAAELLVTLDRLVVEQSLHVPDLFVLAFRDDGLNLLQESGADIGAVVTIVLEVEQGGRRELLIDGGEITAIEREFDGNGTFTVLRGLDRSHRLFRGRKTRSFQQVTYADVAGKVAKDAGLTTEVEPTSTVYPHIPQANETDWELLQGLALEVGRELLVAGNRLIFRKPAPVAGPPAATLNPLENMLMLQAAVTAGEQVAEVMVNGWDPTTKRAVQAKQAPPGKPGAAPTDITPSSLAGKFGSSSVTATGRPYQTQAEAAEAASALAEELAAGFTQLSALVTGNPRLQAGSVVELQGSGKPFDGLYRISSARHIIDTDEGYTVSVEFSGRRHHSLYALSSGDGTSAGSHGLAVPGVVTALVTNNKDPDQLGRVKVKYPWLGDTYESHWVRVAQLAAGNGYGAMLLPEVGEEVLCAFDHGHVQHPYVVGRLYNGRDKPTMRAQGQLVDGSGRVTARWLESRRHHRLVFADDAGKNEAVTLSTGDDKLVIDLNQTKTHIEISSDGTIRISGTRDITIESQQNLNLSAQKIALRAKTGVVVDGGSGPVDVTSKAKVGVQGTAVTVNGQGSAELTSNGVLTVRGSLVKIN